jgi:hypothetical protein
MPKSPWVLVLMLVSVAALAEDFGARFEKGYAQLRGGDPEAALASFNELLTETPDSELVRYSVAAAEYGKGVKDLDAGQTEAGVQGLNHARSEFEAMTGAQTPFVREQSGFSAANCAAQLAKHYNDGEEYNQRLQALQNAVADYESVIEGDPKHAAAATNLNHTRYLLKKMLQNPPENKQKSKDDQGDEGAQGEQNQPGDQGEQPQEPEDQQQDKQDQDAPADQKPGEPKNQKSTGQSTEDQNIQAILDSLEDKNREEQKNLRKAKGAPKVLDGKWW